MASIGYANRQAKLSTLVDAGADFIVTDIDVWSLQSRSGRSADSQH